MNDETKLPHPQPSENLLLQTTPATKEIIYVNVDYIEM